MGLRQIRCLVGLWVGSNRPGGLEGAGRVHEILVEASLESFQAAALRWSQIVGKGEGAHIGQSLAEAFQPPLQLGGARRQHRRRLGRQRAARIAQHLSPIRLIRNAVGLHEKHGVGGAQLVRHHRLEHTVLVFFRQRRQRVRRGWPDVPAGQPILSPARQPGRQLHTAGHPVRLLPEQMGNRTHGQVIVDDQRLHDARLVERGHGARRRVGHEQESLVVHGGERPLHDRGDGPVSGLAPPLEPLEAIEDLVVTVVGGHDPQRPVGQL